MGEKKICPLQMCCRDIGDGFLRIFYKQKPLVFNIKKSRKRGIFNQKKTEPKCMKKSNRVSEGEKNKGIHEQGYPDLHVSVGVVCFFWEGVLCFFLKILKNTPINHSKFHPNEVFT